MKIFISHSSADKDSYVDLLVKFLGERVGLDNIIYDKYTFEAGEKSIDEINRTLGYTDLFVVLLSSTGVNSDWVKYELSKANTLLNSKKLNRIFPIIIDSSLIYNDDRIPVWLNEYNLKCIIKPAKAAKLIVERAKNDSWQLHPIRKAKKDIFVGRNDLISNFEERNDDFERSNLTTLILSGLEGIGRKSLSRQCLVKTGIIPEYYEFPKIFMDVTESIEDFILKINDLGFTDKIDLSNLALSNPSSKIDMSLIMLKQIQQIKEIILIQDNGCIVDFRGDISDWFKNIVSSKDLANSFIFIVISRFKANFDATRTADCIFSITVPELNRSERAGLLRRRLECVGIELYKDDILLFLKYLTGLPAQIVYATDIIEHEGVPCLKRNISKLSDYSEKQAAYIMNGYMEDKKAVDLLAIISEFGAIGFDTLSEILGDGYSDLIDSFQIQTIIETEGVGGEYLRLNDIIKDYVSRANIKISPEHRRCIDKYLRKDFDDYLESFGIYDFLYTIKVSVSEGKAIPPQYAIPSIYLKSMVEQYSDSNYKNVVRLADLALVNSNNYDQKIIQEIRFRLCLALAKLQDRRFLDEVKMIFGTQNLFLLAFYYRQVGRNDLALENIQKILSKVPEHTMAKREKVIVLKNLQMYSQAMDLAKENYYRYSDNPYHIQAYIECLIANGKFDDIKLFDELLERLSSISGKKAESMYDRCSALFTGIVMKNDLAYEIINDAYDKFPCDRKYINMSKFEVAQALNNFEVMQQVITEMEKDATSKNYVIICKSKMLAKQGNIDAAIELFNSNIRFFTEDSKQSFISRLRHIGY